MRYHKRKARNLMYHVYNIERQLSLPVNTIYRIVLISFEAYIPIGLRNAQLVDK